MRKNCEVTFVNLRPDDIAGEYKYQFYIDGKLECESKIYYNFEDLLDCGGDFIRECCDKFKIDDMSDHLKININYDWF